MNYKYIFLFLFLIVHYTLCGSEVIWFPLYESPGSSYAPITTIGQKGSEIILVQPIGFYVDPYNQIPSEAITVNFPTIFVVDCIGNLQVQAKIGHFDNILYDYLYGTRSKYNYDLGDGWIFHQKGNMKGEGPRLLKSMGWIYIKNYPWIYGLDFGWRYTVEAGIAWNANAWWFFEPEIGWIWTTRDMYPNIYSADNGWLIYPEY